MPVKVTRSVAGTPQIRFCIRRRSVAGLLGIGCAHRGSDRAGVAERIAGESAGRIEDWRSS
jgi:hypothetical protein